MTNETKQTAVEWLIEKLTNRQNGVFDGFPYLSVDEIYEQAKEMEKKQIEDAELRSKEIIIIKHTEHEGGNK
jgi:hypothetical protein